MADSSNSFQIPWASLAVVATIVSGTLLMPAAFDLLRPPEKERAQALVGSEFEVDARLWEDPFSALRRHESERRQRCEKEDKAPKDAKEATRRDCDPTALNERRDPKQLRARLDPDRNGKFDNVLVLAVLVPGHPFVGAEEARRRTRYAVHAGLEAERHLPETVDQLGLLRVDIRADRRDRILVPYEVLSDRRYLSRKGKPQQPEVRRMVAVLWIDESALPSHKLDGLAQVLDGALGGVFSGCKQRTGCPSLQLLGPSSSDGLRSSFARLAELADAKSVDPAVKRGLQLIANATMFNTSATLEETWLLPTTNGQAAHAPGQVNAEGIQAFVKAKLAKILGKEPTALEFKYRRTISNDKTMMEALAAELGQRLGTQPRQRVVTLVESDPLFSRPYEEGLRRNLESVALGRRPDDRIFFYRGIDGMTARDGAARDHAAKPCCDNPKGNADARTAVEWPESRDQLDYIRRMAAELRRSESVPYTRDGRTWEAEPIGAIGILAGDVHDKLLLLQALHETFPDKVFFTSDMDARLLHPRTLPFTRNLLVASSLPLQFPMASVKTVGVEQRPTTPKQLQAGIAPLRDVFQASTYAAVRLAACKDCDDIEAQLSAALDKPSIYELGRSGAIALAGVDYAERRAKESTHANVAVLGIGTLLVVVALGVWPSTPAVTLARASMLPSASERMTMAGISFSSLLVAIYALVLGWWAGSAVEALWPHTLGVAGVFWWAIVAGAIALLIYPGLMMRTAAWRAFVSLGLVLLLAWAWRWVDATPNASPPAASQGEPLAWLEGISGWPSHFINVLAILAGVFALDRSWKVARDAHDKEHAWLGVERSANDAPAATVNSTATPTPTKPNLWLLEWIHERRLGTWIRSADRDCVYVEAVWKDFRMRAGPDARGMRIAFWYLLTVGVTVSLFLALHDEALPNVPVRGHEHRSLITLTMFLALALLPLVIVAVADATRLTHRLIVALSSGRSVYPPSTVDRFAAKLGADHRRMWSRLIAAEPRERNGPGQPPPAQPLRHTLLDDWIDMRLIARHSDAVTPLVIAPFAMLTLMVVARSRLFDNWALTWPIALVAALCVVGLGALTVTLKLAAEGMRATALDRMRADLRWLQGSSADWQKLIEPMRKMIETVENERRGAFAAPFDQWFFKAMLVPLGGAGGAQLVERLLMAR